jgi:hypothetical protein
MRTLVNMDRRELADIGLNSSDVRDACALPLDRDPTELLAQRARERRRDAFGAPPPLWGEDPLDEDPDDRPGRNLRRRVSNRGPRELRVVKTG